MKILLFGATGAFGTEFESLCIDRGATFVGLTHADVDIADGNAVRRWIDTVEPDVVVNSVALVGIDACESDPDLAFRIHASAVRELATACETRGCIFIQPSSHAVFDGRIDRPYTEDDVALPLNIYGVSKLAGDLIAQTRCAKHYVVRFPTLYGRRRNASLGFVDKMVRMLRDGTTVRVADDKMDSVTYTLDAAGIVYGLAASGAPYGLYHVTNAGVVSYFDFVSALRDRLGSPSRIERAKDADFPSRAPKPLYTALESRKLPPARGWRDALGAYVRDVVLTEKKAVA